MKLSDYFCTPLLYVVIKHIKNDSEIKSEEFLTHIKNCEKCSLGIKKIFENQMSKVGILKIIKRGMVL